LTISISDALISEWSCLGRVYPVIEITIGSNTYLFSKGGVSSASEGNYLDRIESWTPFSRPNGLTHLEGASGGCEIQDYDGTIGAEYSARRGEQLDWTAEGWIRSNYVDAADHFRFFDGIVTGCSLSGPRMYRFSFGPDAISLNAEENNIPRITRTEWPLAPNASIGQPGQAVYGYHRSAGAGDAAGLIKTIPVDTENNWWYVSIGALSDEGLYTVYRSGTEATSDFQIEHKVRSGCFYTIVRDTADTSDQESDTVHVDVEGIEGNGDGTGAYYDGPIEILQHWLSNFVFGAYPTGSANGYSWLHRTTAPINTTYFDESSSFLEGDRSYKSGRVLKTTDRGIDVLNEVCDNLNLSAFWSGDWTLGIRPFNHAKQGDTGRLILPEHIRSIQGESTTPRVKNRVSVSYFLDDAAGTLRSGPVTVTDGRTPIVGEEVQYKWGETSKV
jgi:hypothetical protein